VNRNEIKQTLLLYRPGSADAEDPQVARAIALAKQDPELARWLDEHCARQTALRAKFRQIAAPDGLKEQIIYEQAAPVETILWRPRTARLMALAAVLVLLGMLAFFWSANRGQDDTLALYQNQMAGIALRGYAMDLLTDNPEQVRTYLEKNQAPSDYVLPASLKKTVMAGCAIEDWQDAKVSMICFRTGKPLAPGESSDLWLFVVDKAFLKNLPVGDNPQFSKVTGLITATWVKGDKLYLLGTEGDEQTIRKYL
jgi:nitrogen fixation-related uncharacterized protein